MGTFNALSPAPQIIEQTELLKELAAAQAKETTKMIKVAIWTLIVSVVTLLVAIAGVWIGLES